MEFRHLRCFLALAEELHFGRAAARLAMTQPPLSLNIQQLEASVGAPLFVRNSRGVALTPAGQAFVPRARALLEAAGAAAREAREVAQGVSGQLRVGFAGTVLYRGLPQILRGFAQRHPRLKLVLREMSSSDQLIDLQHQRLEAGFVHTTRVPPGCSQVLVSRQAFVACVPAGHALARKRRLAPAALAGEPFVAISRAVSPDYHDRLLALCADHGFEPDVRFELRHWLSVVSVVAQGLGVSLVPAALQQAGLPGAAFVPLQGDSPTYETHCLWRDGGESAALAAFLDVVRG
ncbi:MAG: LysR family transcriptional regulator [Comamonadaceae bacterium]|uniref:LysR family transcriptional regulator n=1 Tax=Hydrogenophaga borbori TaxID=2294117 RepID=A0A372EM76_9BURK|nr:MULTISPECIES: LysR family transcriptional regulator [Hydrogenophaga]NCT96503.1 LysR family transcriptional regulator [Comamonadaceae bacterium]RFP80501.1 LysR family transcriptional regulator [Hydrogenophaga borbori]WQB84949.1 LysR family transcriptional regulator [Hydrogenophaga sp. SNF1]